MTGSSASLPIPAPLASRRPRAAKPSLPLPLLTWPEKRSIDLLEQERTTLLDRISRLKPRSYARIIAEADLRALTRRALQLESAPLNSAQPGP